MHETEERTRQAQMTPVSPATRRAILSWPLAAAVVLVALVLLLGGGTVAIRTLTPSSRETLGIVPTLAPVPATVAPAQQPQAPTAVLVASSPTQQPTAALAATAAATPASATATQQLAGPGQVSPTASTALDAQTVNDVKDAYQRYWDVTAQALRELDASHLAEVATDGELSALKTNIEDLRAQGKAIDTSVEHHFVVNWIQGNQAQVADRYRDRSVYIDPSTKQPLPGEIVPATFDEAPETNVVYLLQLEQGTWKVVGYNNA